MSIKKVTILEPFAKDGASYKKGEIVDMAEDTARKYIAEGLARDTTEEDERELKNQALKKAINDKWDAEVGVIRSLFQEKEKQQAIVKLSDLILKIYNVIYHMGEDEIYVYEDGVYVSNGDRILAKVMERHLDLRDVLSTHLVNEVLGHIKRWTGTREVDEPADLICLKNGVLDLKDLSVQNHSPEYFFRNKIEAEYDPEADCPKIMKFLKEILPEDQIPIIQELAGYCLYKNYNIHKAFMFVGSGANGKSTLINLFKEFLGQQNCSTEPLYTLETNRFAVYSLYGKLANMFADLPPRALQSTAIFKMLTGGDPVPAERKFKDRFTFVNYAKLIFSCNQIPRSQDGTDAFFRRWVIINFPNQFMGKDADKNLIEKITTEEELSGFLNFALVGLHRLLEKGEFTKAKSVDEVRDEYIRMSDSVQAFVMDTVSVAPDEFVRKKELYTSYTDYCREKEYPVESENIFHRRLQESVRVEDYRPRLEDEDGNKRRVQCWKGIQLSPNRENDPDHVDHSDQTDKVVKDVKVSSYFTDERDDVEEIDMTEQRYSSSPETEYKEKVETYLRNQKNEEADIEDIIKHIGEEHRKDLDYFIKKWLKEGELRHAGLGRVGLME